MMQIRLLRADIESLKVDAVVTAAAPGATEDAAVTGGNLLARFVIHVKVPQAASSEADSQLRDAARIALERAEELALGAVGIPALGRRKDGFSYDRCARAMIEAALAHRPRARSLQRVVFCVYSPEEEAVYRKVLEELAR